MSFETILDALLVCLWALALKRMALFTLFRGSVPVEVYIIRILIGHTIVDQPYSHIEVILDLLLGAIFRLFHLAVTSHLCLPKVWLIGKV